MTDDDVADVRRRLRPFDWVDHTRTTYGERGAKRLATFVMDKKNSAGGQAGAGPAGLFVERVEPRLLRSQQFLAVSACVYVGTLLLDRG